MQYGGDFTPEQRKLIQDLKEFEVSVDKDKMYPPDRRAQLYTCLAHDWYQLALEEEGGRLLLKANSVCPGYFTKTVIEHQKENSEFDLVINNLTLELIRLFAVNLNDRC